ncbi:MAG TPA: ABC transporter permease [Thermoanaerobaculia bacterium]|jgi:predicted permease|nr:ABC transporter permease [Thermoanaerobaculia bacterium]
MANMWQESRQALRSLWRSPRITLVSILTLALGTGASLAIFGVVRATLLSPLPFRDPDRLTTLAWELPGGKRQSLSMPEVADLRKRLRSFQGVAAYHAWTFNLGGDEVPERLPGAVVTANLFPLLGVEPAIGHAFAKDGPEAPAEVLLSDAFWHERFGADPAVVGRKLVLDGEPVTVAGVMPPRFRFPVIWTTDLWKVSSYEEEMPREMRFLQGIGRLAPGATLADAQAELRVFAKTMEKEYPDLNEGLGVQAMSIRDLVVKDFRRNLLFLQLTVAAALLLACFNVAMLQLGRAEDRRGEVIVRYALGADRMRAFRQGVLENLWLGLGAGLLGVLIARLGVVLLVKFGPSTIHRLDEAQVGGPELALALLLGVASGFLIGQIPLLLFSRQPLADTLRPGLRVGSGTALRRALVVVQVAVTMVLLVSCGLFLRSLERLGAVRLGFNPDPIVSTGVTLSEEFQDIERMNTFYHDLRQRLEAVPGVEGMATAVTLPLVRGFRVTNDFALVGDEPKADAAPLSAAVRPVSPGYFELLEIPVRRGRSFRLSDDYRAEPVVLVNESFARAFTGGEDGAVDRRVSIDLDLGADVGILPHKEWRIVGVVGDVRQVDLETDEAPAIYVPNLQAPWMETRILVRTKLSPAALAPQIERTVRGLLPTLPVQPAKPFRAAADEILAPVRFQSGLLGAFAGLALLLMSVGLYGILSYSVTRRSREIGLRIALGAGRWHTRRLVVGQAVGIVMIGLVLGLLASFWLGRILAGLLFDVRATDPAVYGIVVALMLATALFACWLPSRRATAIDPAANLRTL